MSTITNFFKKGLLIAATLLILSAKCNKDSTGCISSSAGYSFSVTSEFSTQQEIYSIGDTIFLTSVFPKIILDKVSNELIDYSNSSDIGGNITFSYMDTIARNIVNSYDKFQLMQIDGTFNPISNNPNKGVSSNYVELIDYRFKVAIVPKEKGLFYIAVTNLGSQGIRGKNCTQAGFDMTVTNSNKNLGLFQYALGYTPDALLQKSIYCFRVQ